MARADYDGNFYLTHDSKKYEYTLTEYGFDAEQYEFGDQFQVFVDKSQNIIEVREMPTGISVRDIEIAIGSLGSIIIPVILLLCIWLPIAHKTFGKPWYTFYRQFTKGDIENEISN